MKAFHFRGEIPASKSILNRLLILQSHSTGLDIDGDSDCDDVRDMKRALVALDDGAPAHAGSGGTTFRFLVARASRLMGRHEIKASPRLLERPQTELQDILRQLGVGLTFTSDGCVIESMDWRKPLGSLRLSLARSSQFASAVLLNAWNLPFDLDLTLEGDAVSMGYLEMTVRLCEEAGMTIERSGSGASWRILAHQTVKAQRLTADADVSTAFSVAALGALGGRVEILNFPQLAQPDSVFVELLTRMGAKCELRGSTLIVERASLRAIETDLKNSPDLFPVLATLCALADGRSVLHGAPQLAFKESARIAGAAKLIRQLGRAVTEREDGLIIEGRAEAVTASFEFDADHDHRLAMAAGVAMVGGADIRVTDPTVVNKSYPSYWRTLREGLK